MMKGVCSIIVGIVVLCLMVMIGSQAYAVSWTEK